MARSQVRIIGGRWRSRRIGFAPVPGLRPTPDRVRETLFNWLAPVIEGSRCLDLFAGSGALGLEAASRGATRVVMVESHPAAAAALEDSRARLGATAVEIIRADALSAVTAQLGRFDILFLDPPYRSRLLEPCIESITRAGVLRRGARVYLEAPVDAPPPPVPPGWEILKEGRAGKVRYWLAQADGGAAAGGA